MVQSKIPLLAGITVIQSCNKKGVSCWGWEGVGLVALETIICTGKMSLTSAKLECATQWVIPWESDMLWRLKKQLKRKE